jgi:SAM-dependent methyltransferase
MIPILESLTRRTANAPRTAIARAAVARSRFLDRVHGLRTTDVVSLEQLRLEHPDRNDYVPSPWWTPKRVLERSRIGPHDVFVDIGSGLGRVLYLAARYPFARVEGVEISTQLADESRANLDRARNRKRRRCHEVRVVNADLLDYDLPDDATYVYCFNPVKRALFRALLEKLKTSLDRHPRELTLVYLNPIEHELVLATGRAELVDVQRGSPLLPGPREAHTAHVYRLR